MSGKIEVEGLSVSFDTDAGPLTVLDDVSFEVEERGFTVIVGPSGCGKSTLLSCVAGFEAPTRGEARVDGARVSGTSLRRVFVFQEPGIFPWLTVAENVAFGLRSLSAEERRQRVARWVSLVGLDGFADARPAALSGGMKQRVELARALAVEPDVLYLDEPFAALDALTRLEMRRELVRLREQTRATCLMVTHDVREACELADQILVMTRRPGRICRVLPSPSPAPRDLDSAPMRALEREVLSALGTSARAAVS